MHDPQSRNHDIIVVGASAGGVETLPILFSQLPLELLASVFVVIHMSPHSPSLLPEIIGRRAFLPAQPASHGKAIQPGTIYTAVPNFHLLLKEGAIFLSRGPRENHSRPAIDPLFRSAAVSYDSRVIGVVLTGYLDDGTSGLEAIKRCGGIAVVQDPADALASEMPRNALARVNVDHCVPVSEMGSLLVKLSAEPAAAAPDIPQDIIEEVKIAGGEVLNLEETSLATTPAPFVCPECGGSLWEMGGKDHPRYRCNLGHAYTEKALYQSQEEVVENALWGAYRNYEQYLRILEKMAADASNASNARAPSSTLMARIEETREHIRVLREFLLEKDRE